MSFKLNQMSIVTALAVVIMAGQGYAAATSFVEPTGWAVGDAGTTYQQWDSYSSITGNHPDVGITTNPVIATLPTLNATAPAFVAGSGSYYSFSDDYGIYVDIYNHGATAGTGTAVLVQIAATLNGDTNVYPDSLEIVDLQGNPIAGGGNASILNQHVLFEGVVNSSMGPVNQREEIWEFFLPGYFGDFRVQADVIVHSSFNQIRVDSAIVPEPASMALVAAGSLIFGVRRRA